MSQFEGGLFVWPEKSENVEPVVIEDVSDDDEVQGGDNVAVQPDEPDQSLYRATTSGRLTG